VNPAEAESLKSVVKSHGLKIAEHLCKALTFTPIIEVLDATCRGNNMDIREPEIDREDILILNDDHFNTDNVCIVTGSGTGIGRATAIAAAANNLMTVGLDIFAGMKLSNMPSPKPPNWVP
jgi:hypothetical protein